MPRRKKKLKQKNKRLLIIDADILSYQMVTNSLHLKEHRNENDEVYEVLDLKAATDEAQIRVDTLKQSLVADDIILVIGSKENFRKKLLPSYKGNRTAKKPIGYTHFTDWIKENYEWVTVPGLEADDVMGILHTRPDINNGHETIMVSIDKDMKTIPGWLYNENLEGSELQMITEEEAKYWLIMQCLMGDSGDGYKGCPGVGKVGADAIASKCADITFEEAFEKYIFPEYDKKGISREDAIIQCQMARILRGNDIKINKDNSWSLNLWDPGHSCKAQQSKRRRKTRKAS